MEMFVADSYENATRIGEPFTKSGKLYTNIEIPCDRCGGLGFVVSRVENGKMIPVAPDAGVCYKCLGKKTLTKSVRLYTEKEKAAITRAKQLEAAHKEEGRLAKAEETKKNWMAKNSFNQFGQTFIATGNTFNRKEDLKIAGFKFSPELLWHCTEPHDFDCVRVTFDEVAVANEYGYCTFKEDVKDIVKSKMPVEEIPETEYIGSPKERLRNVEATLIKKFGVETTYGYSNCYQFQTGKAVLVWWTQSIVDVDVNTKIILTATVKEHKEYNGIHQTLINRAIIKEA